MSSKQLKKVEMFLNENVQTTSTISENMKDIMDLKAEAQGTLVIPECLEYNEENSAEGERLARYLRGEREFAAEDIPWTVHPVSQHALQTRNLIREICDTFSPVSISSKKLIKLDLGDPTITGLMPPCPVSEEAVKKVLASHRYDGYGPAVGTEEAREAVVKHFSLPGATFTKDDVILASGCSHALQLSIEAIANLGDNILVPCPGFPLYSTLLRPLGIEEKFYHLDISRETCIDLAHLESLIDDKTRAIIVNNPSNPTGAVFTKNHLEALLRIAFSHKIPIISDEVYGNMTFHNSTFYPLATLEPKVPILTCDAVSKRYMLPGARLGWIIIHDRYGALRDVRRGLVSLAQKIVGPCTLMQGALPTILNDTPPAFFQLIQKKLAINAQVAHKILSRVPGLYPVKPNGAMYMTVGVEEKLYGDENTFLQNLIYEENVFCLPGSVFFCPGMFRMTLLNPKEVTGDACQRIQSFCLRRIAERKKLLEKMEFMK